jgi:predicted nucleic-acid-binding Zn-ribbon protein
MVNASTTWCGRARKNVIATYYKETVPITCKTCLRVAEFYRQERGNQLSFLHTGSVPK